MRNLKKFRGFLCQFEAKMAALPEKGEDLYGQ